MKVLHLLDSINRGGTEILSLDVCRNARKYGIDLTFVSTKGGALESEFRNSGADFLRLNRRLPIDFGVVLKLRKIIKKRKIQIVHGHQPVDGMHLYLATVNLPVKRVLSFHGFITDEKNRRGAQILIQQMDANIAVSRALQNWLTEKNELDTEKNFRVVYNGVDETRLKSAGKSLKKELGLDEKSLLLGMIGNFYRDPRKDQLTVCRALPKVFAEIPNARCIFAGKIEPGAEEKLQACIDFCQENKISDRVHFLGSRSDVPDILESLDLFVFSSLWEGLPIALGEAMLAKVPLIVSDIEPLLEASLNGKHAEVFHVQDALELSEKILKLLNNKGLREDLADGAFKFAQENFSIGAHLENLKSLYLDLLNTNQSE
jgi:glycosyltransferase involved in cell wall biosynthesis